MTTTSTKPRRVLRLNTETINTHKHGNRLYQIWKKWNEAADQHNAFLEWRKENPRPDVKWGSPEMKEWDALWDAKRAELGLPKSVSDPGQIEHDGFHWFMKLRAPIRSNETDEVLIGYVWECAHCDKTYVSQKHERYCCDECQEAAAAKGKAEAKQRQTERRNELSAALAGRHGVCLCCGADFNLKRTTAKVCSERCKKQLQRKPQLIAEHLTDLLPELNDSYEQWVEQLGLAKDLLMKDIFAKAFGGKRPEADQLELAKKIEADYTKPAAEERIKRCLHVAATEAPALAAWLLQQPEDVVEAAFGDERKTVLGAALMAKLREKKLLR